MDPLAQFRGELDQLDQQLVELLGRRFDICRQVAGFKREREIPMMQPARVAEVKERAASLAVSHGMNAEFARGLYALIIAEACRLEDEIIAPGSRDPSTLAR